MSITTKKQYVYRMIFSTFFFLISFSQKIYGQHNGNPLFFQGLADPHSASTKGTAYGNAFVSRSGDLNALFYNSAGLCDISSVQVSISSETKGILERENQNFYPGNDYLNTSLYLERLIIPDMTWNGLWSDSLGTVRYDSLGNPTGTYWDLDHLSEPVQGYGDYSKETADHEQNSSGFYLNHISLAIPIQLAGKSVVAAASFYRQFDVRDYDWNGTHLNPHWGTSTIIQAKEGDTTRTDWSVFSRKRTGGLYGIKGATAVKLIDNLQFGIRFNHLSGETSDLQTLDRVGYFLTKHQYTQWAFSYDTYKEKIKGISRFKTLQMDAGALFTSDHLHLGFNFQFPYTIERKWEYTTYKGEQELSIISDSSGVDRVSIPAAYTFGLTLKPGNGLILSFDYGKIPFQKAEYELDDSYVDSLTIYNTWIKQTCLRFGIEYNISNYLSILGGYQTQGAPFIPYGVAIRNEGPPSNTFSLGVSLQVLHGSVDIAYSVYQLKYYDAYITNRNFTLEQIKRFSLAYTLSL